jgi:hypothetical protein
VYYEWVRSQIAQRAKSSPRCCPESWFLIRLWTLARSFELSEGLEDTAACRISRSYLHGKLRRSGIGYTESLVKRLRQRSYGLAVARLPNSLISLIIRNVTMMSSSLRKKGLKLNLNLSALISRHSADNQLDRSTRTPSTARTSKGSDQEDERSHGRHPASCKHFVRRRIHSE